jgi:hypothetical protein
MNPEGIVTILERIERQAGIPGLAGILAERLSPTDLQSLLLEVYRQRASRIEPADVLSNYQKNRFVQPSKVTATCLFQWKWIALANLPPEFQLIEISPVCPLGTCSSVAPVDQNWCVATSRNTEVVSDSTNVLALECALRRRELLKANPKTSESIHLATSQRLLRAQNFQKPNQVTHFHTICLCSAGRDLGNLRFEVSTLGLQIRFYLRALRAFLGQFVQLKLSLTDFSVHDDKKILEDELLTPIRSEFEQVECVFNDSRTSGRGYYQHLCFRIHATNPDGHLIELVDGGIVDWTQKYLGNAKERLLISGIGSERVCTEFGKVGLALDE